MANRYQTATWITSAVSSAALLQDSHLLGPHAYDLVKLKVERTTGSGNINFRIFKKGVWGAANRLARWENVPVPLIQPVDQTSGPPGVEALEGRPLPVDDEDGSNFDGNGKFHYELENLGTASTFTITAEYEERAVFDSAGAATWRNTLNARTSLTLRGSTSGAAVFAAPAAAGSPTLTTPTTSGTLARLEDKLSAFAATTSAELAGVISDETGSGALVFATSPTLVTPTLGVATATRLGVGAAADAAIPLYSTRSGLPAQLYNSAAAAAGNEILRLSYTGSSTAGHSGKLAFTNAVNTEVGNIESLIESGTAIGLSFSVFGASALNSRTVKITGLGSMVLQKAALATNATDGFVYVPTCAGAPTGVPSAQTGTVALIYDTTNNKLYVYNAAWKGVTLA